MRECELRLEGQVQQVRGAQGTAVNMGTSQHTCLHAHCTPTRTHTDAYSIHTRAPSCTHAHLPVHMRTFLYTYKHTFPYTPAPDSPPG